MELWVTSLKEKLDNHYSWPALYVFKFIVPQAKVEEVKSLFPAHFTSEKQSKQGNYSSITINMMMPSSQAVIDVYQSVQQVEGLIAL